MPQPQTDNPVPDDERPAAPPRRPARLTDMFWNGMHFAQRTCETAATLPWTVLEAIGVPADKTRGAKEFNLRLVGRVFQVTNDLAAKAVPGRREPSNESREPGAGGRGP